MRKILFLSLALFAFTDYAVASDEKPSVTQEEVKSEPKIKVLPFVKDEIHAYDSFCVSNELLHRGTPPIIATAKYMLPCTTDSDSNLDGPHTKLVKNATVDKIYNCAKSLCDTVTKLHNEKPNEILECSNYVSAYKAMSLGATSEEMKTFALPEQIYRLFEDHMKEIDELAEKYDGTEEDREEIGGLCSPLWKFSNFINNSCNQSKIREMSDAFKSVSQILLAWEKITPCSLNFAHSPSSTKSFDSVSTFFLNPLEQEMRFDLLKTPDALHKLQKDKTFVYYFKIIKQMINTFIKLNKTDGIFCPGMYLGNKHFLWQSVNKIFDCLDYCVTSVANTYRPIYAKDLYEAVDILMDNYHGFGEVAFDYKGVSYSHIRGLAMLINAMAVALATTCLTCDVYPSWLSGAEYPAY